MKTKMVTTNILGNQQEVEVTENYEKLVSIINNFFLWYSTNSDRDLVESYLANEDLDYIDDWFECETCKQRRNKDEKSNE